MISLRSLLSIVIVSQLALAQDQQVPLREKAAEIWDKAKSYIPSVTDSVQNPVNAAAAVAADKRVEKINVRNWQRKLQPKLEGEEEWMIYMTGGNKSCLGNCGETDIAWNQSVPLLSALPQTAGSPTLRLGRIDCEVEGPLCAAVGVSAPSIWHIQLAQAVPGGTTPKSPLHIVYLNITTTTPSEIAALPIASQSKALEGEGYEGFLHPIDGSLAKAGLLIYLGYVLHFMGTTPSWIIMIAISFISRQFMSRRALGRNRPDIYGQAPPPPAAAVPAPPPAVAVGKTPGSAGKGGKKRK